MYKNNIGIVGCGNISDIYFENLSTKFKNTNVLACCDIIEKKAFDSAKKYGIKKVYSLYEMLEDPDIDVIVNLTVPNAHHNVSMSVLNNGKNLYSEKPFTTTFDDAQDIVNTGIEKNLYVGCAPDTFMGAGLQTCKKAINDGLIGTPIGATAFFYNHGIEDWHPNPSFFYKKGGGPILDMAPYYLTSLVYLIGSVKTVSSMAAISFPERTVCNNIDNGLKIKVETPTLCCSSLEFDTGAIGSLTLTNDVWHSKMPHIEIYGEKATLITPDPNFYDGPVLIRKPGYNTNWEEIPLVSNYTSNSRGLGLSDMIYAIDEERKDFQCDASLALHVMEVMEALRLSAEKREYININTKFTPPKRMDYSFIY